MVIPGAVEGGALVLGVSLLLKSGMVLLAAWGLERLLRNASAAVRHGIWAIALVGLVSLPFGSAWLPPVHVGVPGYPGPSATGTPSGPGSSAMEAEEPGDLGFTNALAIASTAAPPVRMPGRQAPGPDVPGWAAGVVVVWGVGATLRLLWLAVRVARVRRITGRRVPEVDAPRRRLAHVLARSLGIRRQVQLLESPGVTMPLTWGVVRPRVVLPAEATRWCEGRLRVVLLHELAHVRRFDCLTSLLAEVVASLYWPNPLVWLARRRLLEAQELACDDRVLAAGTRSIEYAEHLLAIARAFHGRRWELGAAVAMAREVSLKSRIRTILDGQRRRGPLSFASGSLVVVIVAAVVLPLAALSPAPAAPASPVMGEARVPAHNPEPVRAAAPPRDLPTSRQVVEEASAGPVHLWMEAERSLLGSGMREEKDDLASGGGYIVVPKGRRTDATGVALFSFHLVTPGRYVVWGRVQGPKEEGNSFRVSIDDGTDVVWDVPGPDPDRTTRRWKWSVLGARPASGERFAPLVLDLPAGRHTVRIGGRETGAKLDGLFLTGDLGYRPAGLRPSGPAERPVKLWLEAESAILAGPMRVRDHPDAVGERYVAVDEGYDSEEEPPPSPSAMFHFTVPQAGAYSLWGRTLARDEHDSFWVRVNGARWIRWNDLPNRKAWRWSAVHDSDRSDQTAYFELRQGANTIELAYREAEVGLDRLLLTNDARYEPTEGGE